MTEKELALVLYISTNETTKGQEAEFVHSVFGKRVVKSAVEKGFIGIHASGVYVMMSGSSRLCKAIEIIAERFEPQDISGVEPEAWYRGLTDSRKKYIKKISKK